MKEKKKFVPVSIYVIWLEEKDVICSSGDVTADENDTYGEDYSIWF